MTYALTDIAGRLKAARRARGLSQRALSDKAGLPQSHISRIENGAVDLKVSSLIELARTLGLELMLVPARHVPGVEALIGPAAGGGDPGAALPAYRLDAEDEDAAEDDAGDA